MDSERSGSYGTPRVPQAQCATSVYPRVCGGTVKCQPTCRSGRRVYPRVCGGTYHSDQDERFLGVYPRVCGGTSIALTVRSIPACAGEPEWDHGWEALNVTGSIPACAGEPLCGQRSQVIGQRSIPACAGEPDPARANGIWGSIPARRPDRGCSGLSPRVRGNPLETLSISPH